MTSLFPNYTHIDIITMTNLDFDNNSDKHKKRVVSLGAHKRRTIAMQDFLDSVTHRLTDNQIYRYRSCHNYLLFRYYPELQLTKLHNTKHCDIHLLCPMCAIRRAARSVMLYDAKCEQLRLENPRLRLYYAVLTVKNTDNLEQGFKHLEQSARLLVARRREAISHKKTGRKQFAYATKSILADVSAGAYSFEFKRGNNSGLWHPHLNLLLLSEKQIRPTSLSKEWEKVTGDSKIVYCKQAHESRQSFAEIFKYALKFSNMNFADNYYAWEILQKRRLCGSFGDFRGLEVTKNNEIDPPEEFIELFYRFNGSEYALTTKNRL